MRGNKTIYLLTLINIFNAFFFFFLKTGSYYVTQTGLELVILSPQFLECWDCRVCHHTWLAVVKFQFRESEEFEIPIHGGGEAKSLFITAVSYS
jgi:hypothetical protein